ncbi:MAG: hypothetical protein IAF58_19845 [Leptolyngbya sp.]|nr:hypothetical protein [Candidatus Melainabacteria bacterium]
MSNPNETPSGGYSHDVDEALARSTAELELMSRFYKQRGHLQQASDIEATIYNFQRNNQESDEI